MPPPSQPALIAAEASVLGGCMLEPSLLGELELETDDFADLRHRAIFEAMRNLVAEGVAVDSLTVGSKIEQVGKLDAIGGFGYLEIIKLEMPIASNVIEYARHVRDESIKRKLVESMGSSLARWKEGGVTGRELLDDTLQALNRLDQDEIKDDTQHIAPLTKEHIRWLEAESARRNAGGVAQLTGFPTGVKALDEMIGGWQPGIVSVVCARPGHGKSSLCLASAISSSAAGIGVHVFSLEDPRRIYMNRAIAHVSGVAISKISTGDFNKADLYKFTMAAQELTRADRPWMIDDRSGITSDDVVRSVRRHQRKNGTRLVIVEYLQLIKRSRNSIAKSKREQIGDSLNEMADAAKNDGMAYIVVSQLNRDIEKRDDRRPQESDLRESGTIEERAKCIVGVYRGQKVSPDPQPGIDADYDGNVMSSKRFAETVQLLIMKNSQGPAPERVIAGWHGETTRIW